MEIQNPSNFKILPSLQRKINFLSEYFSSSKRETLIQAYISRGNNLVIDSELGPGNGCEETKYKRTVYGERGGWDSTYWYKGYDKTDMEPYGLIFKDSK